MPPLPLPDIPAGSDVFLDANVLIYGLASSSLECLALLRRCSTDEVIGITSFHIVSEVTHRLMLEEAKSKGLVGSQPRKTLNEHPERVRQLTDYWAEIERLLCLNLLILTIDEDMIRAAQTERSEYGLLNNDSIVVACMRQYGITALATNDATFERVTDIFVYSATDV
jgi:predicted nucleic acid-binding protein